MSHDCESGCCTILRAESEQWHKSAENEKCNKSTSKAPSRHQRGVQLLGVLVDDPLYAVVSQEGLGGERALTGDAAAVSERGGQECSSSRPLSGG